MSDALGWRALPPAAQLYVAAVITVGAAEIVAFFPTAYPRPALFVCLLGFQIVRTWARGLPRIEVPPPAAAPPAPGAEPREKGKRGVEKTGARGQQTPTALVAAIAEKDLFDMSRQKPTEEVKGIEQTPAVTGPPANVTIVGFNV